VDSEYLPSRHLTIQYQFGLDGHRRYLSIPRGAVVAIAFLLLFFLLSSIAMLFMVGSFNHRTARLERLETENNTLRTKVEFYAATVDSIFHQLDTLQAVITPETSTYPSLSFNKKSKQTDLSYDPALKSQISMLETQLSYIIGQLPTSEKQVASSFAELNVGNIPADSMPSIYPTFGRISDGWGLRVHPITNTIEFHQGIDIANQMGTPIYATAAGVVTTQDFDTGYGKRIKINHGNGYETLYAHLYSYMVRVGDSVTKGQIIGLMGSTGVSTGPHLHYEVINSSAKVNPTAYLNRIDEPSYAMR
jgi:murein DD-endopeptidase MepM/ murein hydrolase activator NlpD